MSTSTHPAKDRNEWKQGVTDRQTEKYIYIQIYVYKQFKILKGIHLLILVHHLKRMKYVNSRMSTEEGGSFNLLMHL